VLQLRELPSEQSVIVPVLSAGLLSCCVSGYYGRRPLLVA
jgi:hypothetical protein